MSNHQVSLSQLQHPTLSEQEYNEALAPLQTELMALQLGLYQTGKRAIIVLEGTDAAGKGGVIRRLVDKMDPRGLRVYPIGPPTTEELSRHYLQRFWRRIPHAGQLVIFDRSWYGRVLTERVECALEENIWRRAYHEINEFERLLVDNGDILIKLFLTIDADEQLRRFQNRFNQPDKRWKLTAADLDSREHWDEYQQAYQDMLTNTNHSERMWHVVPSNDKCFSRIECLTYVRNELAKYVDPTAIELMPPEVYQRAQKILC